MMTEETAAPDEARAVRDALRSLGYANAFDCPVTPGVCTEPIVVEQGAWELESRQEDGSVRGTRALTAHVRCDDRAYLRATAAAVAGDLAGFDWARAAAEPMRIVGLDAGRPLPRGRDGFGRWAADVPITMTVVIPHGR
jgi:hypothetical protein